MYVLFVILQVNLYPETPDKLVLSLTIRELQPEDFGKYTCIASNSLGEASKRMTLAGKLTMLK
jgi:hypothetical protein